MLGYDMNVIERGVRGIFGREFVTRQRKAKYPLFASVVDSDKQEEKYNAISTLPQLALVEDERVLAGFTDYSYTITNKVYATGIKVPRTLFEFDQTGQLRTLVGSLGSRVANFPDKLTLALLGTNGNCYDSTAMFSTASHDIGGAGSQGNQISGGLTNTILAAVNTKALRDNAIVIFQMNFIAAKEMLLAMLDDRGEPWHEDAEPESLAILCHPHLEFYVRTAMEATIIAETGNVTVKSVGRVLTTNYMTAFHASASDSTVYKGTWYLFKIDTSIKPLIFQRFGPKKDFPDTIPEEDQSMLQALNSVEVQSIMRTGSNIDAHTFFDDEFLFGARVIYSAGYGMWQNCIKVEGGA